MKKKVELPLTEPIYSTYHFHICGAAVIRNNPSIRNWYLNNIMILCCNRKFLSGFTSPEINIYQSSWSDNPYLAKFRYDMKFAGGHINKIIRAMLDNGYYVAFHGIDDYYVEGKSWYMERHFQHDGMICGYDQEEKTYTLYAYDKNWICRPFKTPQKSFDAGRAAMFKKGVYGAVIAIKPVGVRVELQPETIRTKLTEYLALSLEKYPVKDDKNEYITEGNVSGIAVHDYIAMYLDKLADGSIPYEKMDRRVFRLIWEHKKVMLERLQKTEATLGITSDFSTAYAPLVTEADKMRMLYASHSIKRRDSVLPIIRKKLIELKANEQIILTNFIEKIGGTI